MRVLAVAAAVLALTACHQHTGGSPSPFPTPTPGGPLLYVSDPGNNSIFIFSRTAANTDLPQRTVNGPATLLTSPFPIAADPSGNVWVSNASAPPVLLEFPSGAVGNQPPSAIMTVSGLTIPGALAASGLTFDAAGKLYVATGMTNHILVFSNPGNGAPAPSQDINGLNTQMNDAEGIALDSSGNIYTASRGSNAILEFAAGATGNVAPVRVIQGFFNTHLTSPSYVAIDPSGNVFTFNGDRIIREYAAAASGDAAPIASFSQPDMGGQMVFDSSGNLFVGALNRSPGAVLTYAPPITSSSLPLRLLQSPVFSTPLGVFAP